jgi:Flp pilus assembly protein TadG
MKSRRFKKNERGAALVEFAIVATVFLSVLFGVIEFGRLFWTHNALRDAARRGVRYATLRSNDSAGVTAVKKVVVYGDPNASGSAQPVVPGLTTNDVDVTYSNYTGVVLSSKATVAIRNPNTNQTYQFQFNVPLIGGAYAMPDYKTSLPGESAGYVPCNGGGIASCGIIPAP